MMSSFKAVDNSYQGEAQPEILIGKGFQASPGVAFPGRLKLILGTAMSPGYPTYLGLLTC
jgi:hypothetical protein